jgi:hypothetical protein
MPQPPEFPSCLDIFFGTGPVVGLRHALCSRRGIAPVFLLVLVLAVVFLLTICPVLFTPATPLTGLTSPVAHVHVPPQKFKVPVRTPSANLIAIPELVACLLCLLLFFIGVVLCCLKLSCFVFSCVVLSCVILSCLSLCCVVLRCLILSSCLVLSYLILSCLVVLCCGVILSCLVLSCLLFSSLALSYLVSSCLFFLALSCLFLCFLVSS